MSKRISGTVKFFNKDKGYGFIKPDDGEKDVFVHYSAIVGSGYRNLEEDQRVEFGTEMGDKGIRATEVTSATESPAEESPAEESPAEESPAEESLAEESLAEESLAEESLAEESLAEESLADS